MVTEKTKLAIQNARQNGHRAFLCTGRAPTSIVGDIRNIEFDGAICSAGGFVIVDGEYIFENFMNQYILSEVMTYSLIIIFIYIRNKKKTLVSDTRCE